MSSRRGKIKKKAVTLIELLVVIIIIAILATLALPRFAKTLETTRGKEAKAALEQIRAGERIYRIEENFYYPYQSQTSDMDQINKNLRIFLDIRDRRNWDYEIDCSGLHKFGAKAIRTTGKNTGEEITLDEEGTEGGDWSP